ncbi:hypothetical protein MNBD_UNCLBAC01-1709 [hydrothermal vent metagenome]|uniref:Hydrogenase maturation protease n=1 Tax=hydrothermal vent metagenome TaxID=652676 RepID=A0A3B1D8U4_9ZZZZ
MITTETKNILLIGYGNPGRLDDGLGPALAAAVEHKKFKDITVDANYMLTVEDASVIAENNIVIFADASVNGPEPFSFKKIEPKSALTFSSHSNEPEAILGLAHDMFHAKTEGYVLGIRGYEFDEFGEKLSSSAQDNLILTVEFIFSLLETKDFSKYNES